MWLRELLKKLGHPIIKAPQLFSDNIGATYLCACVPSSHETSCYLLSFCLWLCYF